MKAGTRVKLRDNSSMRAWGCAGKVGVVVGPDPKGINRNVVAVKLDNGISMWETGGIHEGHLETIQGGQQT